jgi:hypothetical protein
VHGCIRSPSDVSKDNNDTNQESIICLEVVEAKKSLLNKVQTFLSGGVPFPIGYELFDH